MIYQKENMKKVKKDTKVFDEEIFLSEILKYLLTIKGEFNKVGQKTLNNVFKCMRTMDQGFILG